MGNYNLELLIRKNKGKQIIDRYHNMFLDAGFNQEDLKHIDLKRSDELINEIRTTFASIQNQEVEILSKESNYWDSILLKSMLMSNDFRHSYVFSDDVDYCGMYIASNQSILKHSLNVAKLGYSNTCFILDEYLKFSFTINFYVSPNTELTDQFDIHLKVNHK